MLEFPDQAQLRQAEMCNETFLCESQLRLHKTTTGFVEEEVTRRGGYYEFVLEGQESLQRQLAVVAKDREREIVSRVAESPKYQVEQAPPKGKGKGKGMIFILSMRHRYSDYYPYRGHAIFKVK